MNEELREEMCAAVVTAPQKRKQRMNDFASFLHRSLEEKNPDHPEKPVWISWCRDTGMKHVKGDEGDTVHLRPVWGHCRQPTVGRDMRAGIQVWTESRKWMWNNFIPNVVVFFFWFFLPSCFTVVAHRKPPGPPDGLIHVVAPEGVRSVICVSVMLMLKTCNIVFYSKFWESISTQSHYCLKCSLNIYNYCFK